eukprot:TRINITY_DN124_c0_g2_i1.p1 TRINITY_DN124_c0_g2~~TRINITY_DN124_c0_g2_i1.p1  ORF type:complete len:537 (+),score=160.17 TRINITY_DN124_c0_g2_i1:114-1724(+)
MNPSPNPNAILTVEERLNLWQLKKREKEDILRKKNEESLPEECSFKPRMLTAKRNGRVKGNAVDRMFEWKKKRDERIQIMQKQREAEQLAKEQCTFQPTIYTNRKSPKTKRRAAETVTKKMLQKPQANVNSSGSIQKHLQRLKKARNLSKEKSEVPHATGAKWSSDTTKPVEFCLSREDPMSRHRARFSKPKTKLKRNVAHALANDDSKKVVAKSPSKSPAHSNRNPTSAKRSPASGQKKSPSHSVGHAWQMYRNEVEDTLRKEDDQEVEELHVNVMNNNDPVANYENDCEINARRGSLSDSDEWKREERQLQAEFERTERAVLEQVHADTREVTQTSRNFKGAFSKPASLRGAPAAPHITSKPPTKFKTVTTKSKRNVNSAPKPPPTRPPRISPSPPVPSAKHPKNVSGKGRVSQQQRQPQSEETFSDFNYQSTPLAYESRGSNDALGMSVGLIDLNMPTASGNPIPNVSPSIRPIPVPKKPKLSEHIDSDEHVSSSAVTMNALRQELASLRKQLEAENEREMLFQNQVENDVFI